MKTREFFIGPMSKNVVDAVLLHNESSSNKIGFIPSRRQIDYNSGYVNNWTTETFSEYVGDKAVIQRDHGGVGQGHKYDSGMRSFIHDAYFFDVVHIDPWKHVPYFETAIRRTIQCMHLLYLNNPSVKFEIGTEEAIFPYSTEQLHEILVTIQNNIPEEIFNNIEYAVVQSGVGLDLGSQKNTGIFSSQKLSEMIEVCKIFGVKSKEHNGDYLSSEEIKQRFDCGLDALNIAPEFGQIETLCYLETIQDIEEWYKICYESKRWEKWVPKGFIPEQNKEELIKICGHYVLSHPDFLKIKPDIDHIIQDRLAARIKELFE